MFHKSINSSKQIGTSSLGSVLNENKDHKDQKDSKPIIGSELLTIQATHHFKNPQGFKIVPEADSAAPSAVVTVPTGFSPQQMRAAYGINKLPTNITGAGQTIAIIDAYNNPNVKADFAYYDNYYGIGNPNALTVVSLGSVSNTGWGLEIALDVQMAHSIAPRANILLVQAKSASIADLMAAVTYANNNGATVVSMSFGATEFSTEALYDSYFSKAGVTYVASAGDTNAVTNWPSVSSKVLSTGGTSLQLTSSGGRISETVWSNTGAGPSAYINAPSYQSSAGFGSKRWTPDIASSGDPAHGFSIYDSFAYNGNSGFFSIGGTSVSAPFWAGVVALINHARQLVSKPTLSTNQLQTYLYSLKGTSAYSTDIYDIIAGSTGPYGAGSGFDRATGIGSPNCNTFTTAPSPPIVQSVLQGSGAPSSAIGNNYDAYLNTVTGDYYNKLNGSWIRIGNILPTPPPSTPGGVTGGLILDSVTNI